MGKEQSTIVKGLAILMMIFLHLFNNGSLVSDYTPLLWIGSTPLVNIITRSCSPVGIFLLVSGYGLSYCRDAKRGEFKDNCLRIVRLYTYYWFILLVFVSIGCFVRPAKYPGSLLELLTNVIGLNCSYNAEAWFLFPYALLAITSPIIFKAMDKIGNLLSFFFSSALFFVAAYIIHAYVVPHNLYNVWWMPVVTYFDLLVSFVLGAILYRFFKSRNKTVNFMDNHQFVAVISFLLFFALHFITDFQGLNPFYEFVLIILFLQINFKGLWKRLLLTMGKYSMPMWLTHTFYSNYLFHDFVYGFKYPLVIYVALILMSYLTARIVMFSMKPVVNRIR